MGNHRGEAKMNVIDHNERVAMTERR
jgi:hypothetical protein